MKILSFELSPIHRWRGSGIQGTGDMGMFEGLHPASHPLLT